MSLLASYWRNDAGASAAEYALILALIGTAMAAAAFLLAGAIGDSINQSAACMDGAC